MNASERPLVLAPSDALFALAREAFERDPDAVVALTTSGTSMKPMLRDRKDVVYLTKLAAPPKKYDVVLFQRDSGAYVLHRVVRVEPDGGVVFCGDNQTTLERVSNPDLLIAVVRSFKRGNFQIDCRKSVFYFFYVRIRTKTRLIRKIARGLTRRIRRAIQKRSKIVGFNENLEGK